MTSGRPVDPAAYEVVLRRQRDRAEALLAELHGDYSGIVAASLDSNADDEHDPEGSTIAFERSQVGALVAQTRHQLAELDAALERLAAASYGVCERCGADISPARLEARPVARTCVAC